MSSLALWFLKSKTDSVVGGTGFASETGTGSVVSSSGASGQREGQLIACGAFWHEKERMLSASLCQRLRHFPEFLGAGTLEIKRAGLPRAAAFAASAFGVISFRASMITLFH